MSEQIEKFKKEIKEIKEKQRNIIKRMALYSVYPIIFVVASSYILSGWSGVIVLLRIVGILTVSVPAFALIGWIFFLSSDLLDLEGDKRGHKLIIKSKEKEKTEV